MDFLSGFSRKRVREGIDLEITLEKLQLLAAALSDGASHDSDLRFWLELIDKLDTSAPRKSEVFSYTREAYHILFRLYLKRHHPDLIGKFSSETISSPVE